MYVSVLFTPLANCLRMIDVHVCVSYVCIHKMDYLCIHVYTCTYAMELSLLVVLIPWGECVSLADNSSTISYPFSNGIWSFCNLGIPYIMLQVLF